MLSFTELLTASDSDLVKTFYKIKTNPKDDFILRINKVAAQLGLNHSQLVCALGFNKYIRNLSDIYSTLGFRSYRLLSYRCKELFSTDTYNQLSVEDILDIYSERLEDQKILDSIRGMLESRLAHIEDDLDKSEEPAHVISYRMEIHSIYSAGVVYREFAEMRLQKDISKFRILADEVLAISEANLLPPSNMFFMDSVSPAEKKTLIEKRYIDSNMIKNRLQNKTISQEERDMLEEHL